VSVLSHVLSLLKDSAERVSNRAGGRARNLAKVPNLRKVETWLGGRGGGPVGAGMNSRANSAKPAEAGSREPGEGEDVLVGEDPRGVMEGGPDVFRLQMWVLAENLGLADAIGQHTHDKLDGDAGAPDHGLAHHDLWIDADSVLELFFHVVFPTAVLGQRGRVHAEYSLAAAQVPRHGVSGVPHGMPWGYGSSE